MKNCEIKQAFKNCPDAGLPDNEQVTCHKYEQCMDVITPRTASSAGMAMTNA